MTKKPKIREDGTLIFEDYRFMWGRNNCQDWSGFVRAEFTPASVMNSTNECYLNIIDNLTSVDGDYSPLSMVREQLEMLRAWIDKQLEGFTDD